MVSLYLKNVLLKGVIVAVGITLPLNTFASDFDSAKNLSENFNLACQTRAWQLWPQSLCGPILFVNPNTREIFATQEDAEGHLSPADGLFTGTLPKNETIANTAKNWGGKRWSMIMLPLPNEPAAQLSLLAHESFHRIQPDLYTIPNGNNNSHLSQPVARLLMLLEMRALAQALTSQDHKDTDGQRQALNDALVFRQARYNQFNGSQESERILELNEGIAEYTGIKLNGDNEKNQLLANSLIHFNRKASLERSFAYGTGPAYGLLLDELNEKWKDDINEKFSFSQTMLHALNLSSDEIQNRVGLYKQISNLYGGEKLWEEEQERAAQTEKTRQEYIAKFSQSPTLAIPLQNMQMSFNPSSVFSLNPYGTVYPTITVIDTWGKIVVNNGALIGPFFRKMNVSLSVLVTKNGDDYLGDGWTLSLNQGWKIIKTETGMIVSPQD